MKNMQIDIVPATVKGTVKAPASKSVMQRACAAALLHEGETLIRNYGKSEDDKAALAIIQLLGAELTYTDGRSLKVKSNGILTAKPGTLLDCSESGLSLRMFTPLAALTDGAIAITGKGSLQQRPVHFLETVLNQLGIKTGLTDGRLPLQLQGPLQPADITIDGSLTSQLLTGLLMAYAVAATKEVAITVTDLKSKPYIDLTLKVMEDFKMPLPVNEAYRVFRFNPAAGKKYTGNITFTVEGDWSNAAFLMVAGAIAGSITVTGLDVFTSQADKKVLEALQDCGCRLSIQAEEISVVHQPLKAFHFDATDCPDLFPPLVALAAYCQGTSVLEGVHRLEHKESNRALTLIEEFAKMGVAIEVQDDKMLIRGGGNIKAAVVHSHNDHRIAMACAIAALRAEGTVTVVAAGAVDKSYPDFWDHLSLLTAAEPNTLP
jgi:3-phosphoshikimate 1-carboxyvinyltransferase